ncbi:MAG: hypothetical protein QW095_04595, partial [Nitrososphaerota archaeon]
QGEDKSVEEFVDKLKTLPPHVYVKELSIEETKPDSKLKSFMVKYGTIGDELHEGFGPIQYVLEEKLSEVSSQITTLKNMLEEVTRKLDELVNLLRISR